MQNTWKIILIEIRILTPFHFNRHCFPKWHRFPVPREFNGGPEIGDQDFNIEADAVIALLLAEGRRIGDSKPEQVS